MTANNTKEPQINVAVDFTKGRAYGPMGVGLHRNFLTFDRLLVGATIAALYHNPEDDGEGGPRLTNTASRAMVQLALYASGCAATLDRQQFRGLERRVRRYASEMASHHFESWNNLSFARWVLKHAVKRAKTEKVI
jgi:hypothetical protein